MKSVGVSSVLVHGDVTGLPQQPVERVPGSGLTGFAPGKVLEGTSGLLPHGEEQAGLSGFSPDQALEACLDLLRQLGEQARRQEFPFSGDEHCSAVGTRNIFGLSQQPFEYVMMFLNSPFVTEVCPPVDSGVSGLLQLLPESAAFPLLVEGHCLTTVGALGGPQHPLEQLSPLPSILALWCVLGLVILPAQQESAERRSLPREKRLGGAQQDSCPSAIKARQIHPRASSLARYLVRAERRCCSHGFPSGVWQLGVGSSTDGR